MAYCKLGLAGSGPAWRRAWRGLRGGLMAPGGPAWVAVAYCDWERAGAPAPADVLAEAVELGCAGVLADTWAKGGPGPWESDLAFWSGWVRHANSSGIMRILGIQYCILRLKLDGAWINFENG